MESERLKECSDCSGGRRVESERSKECSDCSGGRRVESVCVVDANSLFRWQRVPNWNVVSLSEMRVSCEA